MPNAKLIKEKLLQNIPAVCRYLLPDGYDDGTNWRVGSIRGELGDSLAICLIGERRGLWLDHAASDRGDILKLWMLVRGIPFPDALDEAEVWLERHAPYLPTPLSPEEASDAETHSYIPCPFPSEVACTWNQGVRFLSNNPAIQCALDQWRRWPLGTTAALCAMNQIACIDCNGRPHWAFRVEYPHQMGTVTVGYHARPVEQVTGDRTPWFYHPNQRQNSYGIPSVPFVLESDRVEGAELIVVTEGQWDAVTWASAAGWLEKWPGLVTVFGLRGANSWKTFLNHWGRYLPKTNFLLVPDHDEAGLQWRDEFAADLRPRARSVQFLIPPPGLDFSEWQSQEQLGATFINGLLRSLGILPTC